MLALEQDEVVLAIVFLEVGLAVHLLVLKSEKAVHPALLRRVDVAERLLLHLLKLGNERAVHLEIPCAVRTLVAELLASHAPEHEQAGHVERRVHQQARCAIELLGIEGAHAGGHNKVGPLLLHHLAEHIHCLKRAYGDVRAEHRSTHGIQMTAHLHSRSAAARRSEAMQIEDFFLHHLC